MTSTAVEINSSTNEHLIGFALSVADSDWQVEIENVADWEKSDEALSNYRELCAKNGVDAFPPAANEECFAQAKEMVATAEPAKPAPEAPTLG